MKSHVLSVYYNPPQLPFRLYNSILLTYPTGPCTLLDMVGDPKLQFLADSKETHFQLKK